MKEVNGHYCSSDKTFRDLNEFTRLLAFYVQFVAVTTFMSQSIED